MNKKNIITALLRKQIATMEADGMSRVYQV